MPSDQSTRSRGSLAGLRRLKKKGWTRPISPTSYARGVSACLENARSLLDDALILSESGRHSRAVALAVLTLEEGDKIRQLLLLCMGEGDAKGQWEAFRNHRPRLSSSLSLLTHGRFSLLQRAWASEKRKLGHDGSLAELPHLADLLKQRCLYADLLSDGTWSVPSRVVPKVASKAIIGTAALLLGITTTLVLGTDMVLAGQLEPMPGQALPDLGEMSQRGKAWHRWRMGRVGQQWGARELARHLRWVEASGSRMTRIVGSEPTRRRPGVSSR